jgi:hypothetical protein
MTTLSPTTTLAKSPGVLAQQMQPTDSTLVLLNPQSGEYYTLEAVGPRVWQLCDGKRTISEIAAIIAEEYDQSPQVIADDVLELLKDLMDEALVVTAS